MKRNVIIHLCKLLGVALITLSAFSVFGYTNVYGEESIINTSSIVNVLKDIKLENYQNLGVIKMPVTE